MMASHFERTQDQDRRLSGNALESGDDREIPSGRLGWPILIALLAGMLLALFSWLPAEFWATGV